MKSFKSNRNLQSLSPRHKYSRHQFTIEEREQIFSFFSIPENWDMKKRWELAKELNISVSILRTFMMKYNFSTKRECKNCGIEFITHITNRYYCSIKCRWEYRHPIKKCQSCGVEFRGTPHQVNCSQHRQIQVPKVPKICPTCKKEFMFSKKQVYCSFDCAHPILVCKECEKNFRGEKPTTKFCSKTCFHNWKRKDWLKRVPLRICRFCQKKFQPPFNNPDQVYCGKECRDKDWIKIGTENAKNRDEERIKRISKKRVCLECSVEFLGENNQKYCSVTCRNEAQKKREYQKRLHPCKNCGKTTDKPKYCCENCQRVDYKKGHSPEIILKCRDCGAEFLGSKDKKRCCKCSLKQQLDSMHNLELAENSVTRMFAKFLLLLREIDREIYLKVYRELRNRENNPKWFDGNHAKFRKKIDQWQKKLSRNVN